ncbi:MAG: hypothetical protein HYZ46_05600 [Nitrosomonadales bacterium]|nr:hypothetical protein [Nitrosomonadales bacterium]
MVVDTRFERSCLCDEFIELWLHALPPALPEKLPAQLSHPYAYRFLKQK